MIFTSAPLRFLVTDDDEDIRTVLVRMVERLGHTADQARDGVEAIEALALASYDFMLLDLTMPRMTGQDVLRWLREHPEWAEGLRVILVSAATGPNGEGLEELGGAWAVLPKPLRTHELRHLIEAPVPAPA